MPDTALAAPDSLTLTAEQRDAFNEVAARLQDGERFTTLRGFAGTGKTVLAGRLAGMLAEEGRTVVCCAPTHKATQVLREKLYGALGEDAAYGVSTCTLHALLGLRLVPDGEGGYGLEPEPRRSDLRTEFAIVDEASMIGAAEWTHIEKAPARVQWVFVGDPAQLPPVGEGASPALEQPGPALKTICRQGAGSPILTLSQAIRTDARHRPQAAFADGVGVAVTRGRDAFIESAARAFATEAFREDAGHARLLAYRNRTVREYNAAIRAALRGDDDEAVPRFESGEWLVARETWLRDGTPCLWNSEEVRVKKATLTTAEADDLSEWKIWRLKVRGVDDGQSRTLEVLHESEATRFREELSRRRERAIQRSRRWKAFYALKERFAEVDYAYAMTSHKAQGSTFDTAFVDWRDLAACRGGEQQALRYVAVTRPARRLALLV